MSTEPHNSVPADSIPSTATGQHPATPDAVHMPYEPARMAMYGAPGYPPHPALANPGVRLGARLLDIVIWYVGYILPAIPVMIWIDEDGGTPAVTLLLTWLVSSFVIYFPFCTWKFGSTLGKRICKIRVVRRHTAQRIGFWRAVGREMFYVFAAVMPVLSLLNPLWCCWDKPYQQCLHDKVADTVAVIR